MSGTRWMWVPIDGTWALAYGYMDPMAGPSAKGAIVSNPPTFDEIRTAIDHPNRTFREPTAFGAVVITAEDAMKMGLPKDPPWIGFFEKDKAVPPPRGEPSRVVIAIVTQNGQPVANAEVKLGEAFGVAREVVALHTLTSDENGRCVFPLARRSGLVVVARTPAAGSKQTDVVPERDFVEVPLVAFGALEGMITQSGTPIAGSVSITGQGGGVHRVKRGDATGHYRIDGVVPDTYDVRVESIDPETLMTAGTPTLDVVTIAPGSVARRDFSLVAGVSIDFQLRVQHNSHNGSIYLLRGEHAPQTSVELYEITNRLGRTQYLSTNSSSNNGTYMTTRLADVTPGVYTMCITPTDYEPDRHREQPVMVQRIVVGSEPMQLELELVGVRRSDPKPAPAPGPRADVRPPPLPPKRR
ncbi:MAG: hypothetical protein ACKV2T_23900 [Kofleriaceae bacterium]